jgi:hypothetical protein
LEALVPILHATGPLVANLPVVKLIYFDESKNDPVHPHYYLGAVCIDEADLAAVEQRVNAIAEKAFGSTDLSRETELHAAHIYGRKGNFAENEDFDKALSSLTELAAAIALPQVQRIWIKINCELLYGSRTPAQHAFMHLVERANGLLSQTQSLGMLIGDRENDEVAHEFSITLSGWRARGTDYEYGQDITRLVDSVHFTHSHLSRFLQLADAYAWFSQFQGRHRKPTTERQKAVLKILANVDHGPKKYKEWPPAKA